MKRKSNTPTDATKPGLRAKTGLKRQRPGGGGKKTSAAAREWQTTFDATSDAIWVLDKEQRVVRSNKMAEQMLQRPSRDLIGKHCWEIMHATTGSIAECPLQRTRKNLRRESMELQVGERWIKVTCDPILDAAGRYGGAVHIMSDITARKRAEDAREAMFQRQQGINQLQQSLLAPAALEDKLKRITDGIVQLFEADFCRIWVIKSGDLCKDGCVHAETKKGPHACRFRKQCLHLMASSSRCTHIDGKDHRRVPLSAHNIGLIASGEEHKFLTNDASNDPRVHNHGWVREMGLVSFAGYQLRIPGGEALGVLALFARHPILPAEDAALDGLSSSIAQVIQQARAEEALRESEAELQLSFEAGQLGNWSWDIVTGEVKWSERCKALYGLPPDAVMSYDRFLQAVHPEDREKVDAALKKAIETRTDYDVEKRIVWPDGSVHWTATRGRVFCNTAGKPVRVLGVTFDITERKKMEQKLGASEQMFRSMVENSHAGIYISDDAFRFTYVNDELCALLGYSRDELIGSDIRRHVAEETLAVIEDRYLRRQQGEDVPSWYEICLLNKDGSKLFVMSSAFTVREPSGRVKTIGQILDITGRKRMEKTLQSTQDLLNDVGRIAQVGGWKMDMIAQKATWTLGTYDIIEMAPGQPIPSPDDHLNYYLPEYQPLFTEAVQALAEDDTPMDFEAQLRTAKGNVKWCHVIGRAIREGGKVVEVYGTLQDITERKRAEETMERERNLLRTLIDHIPDAIYVRDTANRFVLANETVAKRMGAASPADLIGKTDADFYPPEQAAHFAALDREVFAGRTLVNFEEDVVHLDGKRRFILGTKVPLKDAQGEVTALVGIGRDITERKQAEETLERERNLLRTLIDHIPDAIYVRDMANRFVLANKTMARRMGAASPADLIGKTDADFYPPEQAARFGAADREVFAGHALVNFEEDIIHLDGKRRIILTTKVPLRDAQGTVTALVGIARNITERKRVEEALRESEQKYRELVQNANSIILRMDPQGRVNFINEYAQRFFGYSAEEILGRSVVGTIVPETDSTGRDLAQMIQEIAKYPERYATNENENTRRNGERVWVAWTNKLVRAANGEVAEILCIGNDMTERKRIEEALATSERRFRDIANHAQEWIWEVDAEGKYTYASQVIEKVLGYTSEEVLQKHFYDSFHPDDRESLKTVALAAFAAKQPFRELINRNVHKNGQTVWLATSGIPLLDEKGNLLGYRGVDTDITERKRAEEALATSEKRFRDVADHAQECIWEIDAEGRYTYVSQTIERILGYTPEEVLQKNYHDFFHPDDRDSLKVAARAFFAQKQPFRGLIDRNVHKNGQTVWFASSGIPLLDEKGNLLGYRGVSMDITERKQAEEALRESRRALFTLMSNLPGMAYRCCNDRNWTMEFVSQGALALTGYTADELMQSTRISYAQVIHPDDRDAVWDAVQAALQARQSFQMVYRIVTATGVENWVWEKGQGV
ncbi:MAG: PAS domain S-box protein, partial [Verrucomicrobia bacterium]|nr:PAS domain S-box protein [Verrucomicrobiota bacterium]